VTGDRRSVRLLFRRLIQPVSAEERGAGLGYRSLFSRESQPGPNIANIAHVL
jgi:hypothetical protein